MALARGSPSREAEGSRRAEETFLNGFSDIFGSETGSTRRVLICVWDKTITVVCAQVFVGIIGRQVMCEVDIGTSDGGQLEKNEETGGGG